MRRARAGQLLALLWLAAAALLMLLPFWNLLVFSSHSSAEIFGLPPPADIGAQFPANLQALSATPFWQAMFNSAYVVLMSTLLCLAVSSMAGFALAVYRFRGQSVVLALAVLGMLLPPFMTVVPYFFWINQLGWLDQYRAVYMPAAVSGMGVLLMRQYICSAIPRCLLEIGRLDGCSEWRLYLQIVLPLCKPALATLGVVSFIAAWNSFLLPLVVLPSPEHYTVHVALRAMQSAAGGEWGVVMTGAMFAVLPTLAVLIIAARHWRSILSMTADAEN
ncbi:L-arabinose transport system permease protein AraQ [Andreprevotia sp. IGB-42]|uniref:carbohydrate ABC transporter permease n=1 Tax=Andreprevotia sp. IGB-42 TaxID=2497473 RepID=UPI001356BFF1|nr:carbohydrate ABC transporter permease [Andreprevotia sp. IGB-42]KAF0813857.1 L-arabinose transport system permease protein AraQ [Andreprevotia sp. IGB-42]